MAYIWEDGELITAEKLNANLPFIVNDKWGTLDKTWQEIYDAAFSGRLVVICIAFEGASVTYHSSLEITYIDVEDYENDRYIVKHPLDDRVKFTASSPDDYPTFVVS